MRMVRSKLIPLVSLCGMLIACGALAPGSGASAVKVSSPQSCAATVPNLLTSSDMPIAVQLPGSGGTSNTLGLWGGDSQYPGFVSRSGQDFLWTGLRSGTPHHLVNSAWTALNYAGSAPVGFIPSEGLLFTDYPGQIWDYAVHRRLRLFRGRREVDVGPTIH